MKSTYQPKLSIVELLVVLLATTALAALLLPVYSQAGLKVGQGICLTNMKQMVVAARMYGIDYDGKLPVSQGGESNARVVPWKPIGPYR